MLNEPAAAPAPSSDPIARAASAIAGTLAVTALDALLLTLALGGVRALLGHSRALALLAVWCAGGGVLALLRPVRVHSPVALERESRLALVALLVVPVVTPAVGALGESHRLLMWFDRPLVEWMGVVLVALGLFVRIAAMSRLGSRFSPLVAVQHGHVLETRGVYAVIRHPGYLGAMLACIGAMLTFGSALALPLVFAFAGLMGKRIEREEALLEQQFGDTYREYRERTGGLWPRIGGRRG